MLTRKPQEQRRNGSCGRMIVLEYVVPRLFVNGSSSPHAVAFMETMDVKRFRTAKKMSMQCRFYFVCLAAFLEDSQHFTTQTRLLLMQYTENIDRRDGL